VSAAEARRKQLPRVSGSGFDKTNGGFQFIHIGRKRFAASVVIARLDDHAALLAALKKCERIGRECTHPKGSTAALLIEIARTARKAAGERA
jgi:hypothetical protein